MRSWVVIAPALALVVAFFLPLVVIRGPLFSDLRMSACDAVRHLGPGDDAKTERPDHPVVAQAKKELQGLRIPLGGPVLIGLSLAALAAQYALLPVVMVQLFRRRVGIRLHAVWMALGVAYGALFLAGADLTQQGLNQIRGDSVTQQIVAVFSKAAARLYEIQIGAGGIVVTAASLVFLVLGVTALARRPAGA